MLASYIKFLCSICHTKKYTCILNVCNGNKKKTLPMAAALLTHDLTNCTNETIPERLIKYISMFKTKSSLNQVYVDRTFSSKSQIGVVLFRTWSISVYGSPYRNLQLNANPYSICKTESQIRENRTNPDSGLR